MAHLSPGTGPTAAWRRTLVWLPVGMAAVLAATVAVGYRGARDAAETVARGQGEALMAVLRREIREGRRPDGERLEEVLAAHRAEGLRGLAVFDPEMRLIAAAGSCAGDEVELRRAFLGATGGGPVRVAGMLRVATPLPPPRRPEPPPRRWPDGTLRPRPLPPRREPGGGPPPWRDDGGARRDRPDGGWPERDRPDAGLGPPPLEGRPAPRPGDPGFRPGAEPGGRPNRYPEPDPSEPRPVDPLPDPREVERPLPALIEYEPTLAADLAGSSRRTLAVGAIASLALVASALLIARLARREERARARHERERRLAALGEMSAVLAHEIRNPLTSLKGHAQLLCERLPEPSRERDKADRVLREVARLEQLTADLLEFVRSPQVTRSAADPRAVLREAAEAAGEGVTIEEAGAPARFPLDAARMRQVLINLIRNALEASPGRVVAAVAAVPGGLAYSVRDFGPGVPEESLERIFEPFHTTRTRGTGLGLAVSRRIVELHGGRIGVENHPQGGALFRVVLPGE